MDGVNIIELLASSVSGAATVATILLLRVVVTRAEMAEKTKAAEMACAERVDAERRIAQYHETAARTERARAEAAEKALESAIESQRLALSVISALRIVTGKDGPDG